MLVMFSNDWAKSSLGYLSWTGSSVTNLDLLPVNVHHVLEVLHAQTRRWPFLRVDERPLLDPEEVRRLAYSRVTEEDDLELVLESHRSLRWGTYVHV